MAFGFGVLRLPSHAFWSLTPRELMSAVEGAQGRIGGEPTARAALDDLMRAFPDGDVR
jgi:uncharacterized phage protein (TIGR02216 family)